MGWEVGSNESDLIDFDRLLEDDFVYVLAIAFFVNNLFKKQQGNYKGRNYSKLGVWEKKENGVYFALSWQDKLHCYFEGMNHSSFDFLFVLKILL